MKPFMRNGWFVMRDTFAVWNLRHGVPPHSVSKILGHSNPTITAKAYLPWVKEFEAAIIADGRRTLPARSFQNKRPRAHRSRAFRF